MKALLRPGGLRLLPLLLPLLLALGLPLGARAQLSSGDKIVQIVITNIGPATASEELIRANIHLKVGDPFVATSTEEDVRNLYTTGFFYNIQVKPTPTPTGVVVTYYLQGKQKLTHIKFEGNTKFSNLKLLKKVTSKIGEPLDERKLFLDSQEIEKMYQKAGYHKTTVKAFVDNPDETAGRAGARFEITESPKIRIVDVDFAGAKGVTQKKLRKVIKTRKHWMFSWITGSGVFKQDQFDEDIDKLADYYRGEGYIDYELHSTNFVYPSPRNMQIIFDLTEGNRYKVGSVTFKGNLLFKQQEIIAGIRLAHERSRSKTKIGTNALQADVGMFFKPQALKDDIQAVEDFYGARGYIDVRLGSTLRVTQVPNTETGTMDLVYDIDAGEKSYIEKIEIKGNSKTKDKVIRRELAVAPGEVFDMVQVRRSKERLEGLQFFEKVETKPEPTVVPSRKNLIVGVEEKSTGQFTFGAGFSTVESISGFAEVSQSDFDLFKPPYFTGGGQKFRLRIQIGTLLQDYRITYIEPWFLDKKLRFQLDLYHSVFDYQSLNSLYDESRTGAKIAFTRALGSEFLIGTVASTVETVGIIHISTNAPQAIYDDGGHATMLRFDTSLAWDTRNNYTLPNKGQRTEAVAELTTGSRQFYKLEARSAHYFKGFATGHVLELVAKTGVAEKFSSDRDVPFYDRFYMGGQNSLRGYDYRGVGPRQATVDGTAYEPTGGDTYWSGTVEYSIPIISRLRFALFYDIGNVSGNPFSYSPAKITDSTGKTVLGTGGTFSDDYGLGLRLDLPIGPLRLDYGIPRQHDSYNGSSGKFQFGVGFTRPL